MIYHDDYICGDSFEILPTIPNESFDAIETDPPYGLNQGYGKTKDTSRPVATREKRYIANDENLWWLIGVAHNLYRVLKLNKFCVVWSKWVNEPMVREIFKIAGFKLCTVGIWNKEVQGTGEGFCETYEQWLVFEKGIAKPNYMAKNVINHMRMNGQRPDHPHAKPKEVVKKIIHNLSKEGDLILDPFAGTGSTAISCLELKRHYYCIDIEQENVNKALTKIKSYHDMQQFEFRQ